MSGHVLVEALQFLGELHELIQRYAAVAINVKALKDL